jgi:hypothetical protein
MIGALYHPTAYGVRHRKQRTISFYEALESAKGLGIPEEVLDRIYRIFQDKQDAFLKLLCQS